MPGSLVSPKELEGFLTVCILSFLKLQPEEPLGNRFLGRRWAGSRPWGSAGWAEGPPGHGSKKWGSGGRYSAGDHGPGSQWGCPRPCRHRAGGAAGGACALGEGPPPGLSQELQPAKGAPHPGNTHSPPPPAGELTLWPEAHRGRGGRGLTRGPPACPGCLVGSLSQACWGEEAAKDAGELETPTGQRHPLPRGSWACSPCPDGPGSAQGPGEPWGPAAGPGLVCGGCPGPPRPQHGRPRDAVAQALDSEAPSPACTPQGGGDPCILQAAWRLHRNVLAFVWLFPRNWGVSCAQLVLSWLWPDGTRALPAGPARVPGAFGTWGGLRPCEPV